jgi:hypothetical protein
LYRLWGSYIPSTKYTNSILEFSHLAKSVRRLTFRLEILNTTPGKLNSLFPPKSRKLEIMMFKTIIVVIASYDYTIVINQTPACSLVTNLSLPYITWIQDLRIFVGFITLSTNSGFMCLGSPLIFQNYSSINYFST